LLHRVKSASGTKRTCQSCRSMSAFGGKADISCADRAFPLTTQVRCRRGAAPLLDPARSVGGRVRANVEVPSANRAYLAHPTGQAQRQTRMSGSRSIESFRCSCMAALGFVAGVSSLLDAAGPSLRPSERGAHSRQRSAATTLWCSYSSLDAPECAPLLHRRASARDHRARIGWSCPLPSVRL